jgi:hypothetical protein
LEANAESGKAETAGRLGRKTAQEAQKFNREWTRINADERETRIALIFANGIKGF